MNRIFRTLSSWLLAMVLAAPAWADGFAIAVHGGAGTLQRADLDAVREGEIRAALEQAVRTGHEILSAGGDSIEAVIAAVRILEDAPEFNAGRGSVLTSEGRVEMDASIMRGQDRAAGAVASVRGIRNPIEAAHLVMTASPHVMLVGEGAAAFAREQGLTFEHEDWFITDFRRQQFEALRDARKAELHPAQPWYSTVGAVALDAAGNLAAATSTGGMSNKRWGRVGDSPIIGAGTYADNRTCAVSATGHGEYFMRHVVAYDICARMAYLGQSLAQAAEAVVNEQLVAVGGNGGVIAIDGAGNIVMPFNTTGMYRAAIGPDGRLDVAIFGADAD